MFSHERKIFVTTNRWRWLVFVCVRMSRVLCWELVVPVAYIDVRFRLNKFKTRLWSISIYMYIISKWRNSLYTFFVVAKLYTVHKYDIDNKMNTITFFINITVWMYISQNLKTTKSLSNQHVISININISTYKRLNE